MAGEPRPPDSPFWVEPGAVEGDTLRLGPEESHHLTRVFRAGPGAPFEAVDGRGRTFQCVLVSADREGAVGRVLSCREDAGELSVPLGLVVGMPAPAAAEELVERALPLGATRIVFCPAGQGERWRPTAARMARFGRLARAALKQSRRSRLPVIQVAGSPSEAVAAAAAGARFLADPEGRSWSAGGPPGVQNGVALGIGPPGGWSRSERALFEAAGFIPISLGPSRLSTQDAAVAMLALARERILASGLVRGIDK